ncbi:hypothetical protein B9479_005509 [Cryptococcus floricola]|uniref:Uncharacterized protein n=1 Tax=Cryptococcus floricola TaxID=2591691 RepID=A0A5D3AUI1_9TREE|nr:hypothetical protein B9479_005509 [Cryptococcus floricola]
MSVHDENSTVVEEDVNGESSGYLDSDNYLFIPAEEQGNTMERQTVTRHETVSRIDRWLTDVTRASHDTLPAHPNPGIERQLSYLRMRPSRALDWMQEGATSNQKALGEYREENSKPDDAKLSLNVVDAVTYKLMNQRADFASWALRLGYLSVPKEMRSDAQARDTEYQTSAAELTKEGVPPFVPAESFETGCISSVLVSTDFNKGLLQEILDGATEPPSQLMSLIRKHNASIRAGFDDEECWKEFDPKFRTLLSSWNDTLKDLQDAGMEGLPLPR